MILHDQHSKKSLHIIISGESVKDVNKRYVPPWPKRLKVGCSTPSPIANHDQDHSAQRAVAILLNGTRITKWSVAINADELSQYHESRRAKRHDVPIPLVLYSIVK